MNRSSFPKHQITCLANGLNILSEPMPDIETVTVGVWVNTGSRNESLTDHGISHFLEHMAFKGTESRSALDIAEQFDNIGASFNAYTSRENTVYYAKVLKEDLGIAIDILADIVQHSVMDAEELSRERGVILQEIAATYDTPDDIIFDYFQEKAYPDQPLGRPILGTPETVSAFSREDLFRYVRDHHCSENMLVAAAGNLDHDTLVQLVEQNFKNLRKGKRNETALATYVGGESRVNRDLEQVQFVIGFNGVSYHSDDIYTFSMLSDILGGGMSSRLFQEIREKRGLVYSIGTVPHHYQDTGILSIYAGTNEEDLPVLINVMAEELKKMTSTVTQAEMLRARNQVKASLLMSQESSTSRATKLARNYQRYNRIIPLEEILERIAAVTINDIQSLMDKLLKTPPTIAAMGKLKSLPSYQDIAQILVN